MLLGRRAVDQAEGDAAAGRARDRALAGDVAGARGLCARRRTAWRLGLAHEVSRARSCNTGGQRIGAEPRHRVAHRARGERRGAEEVAQADLERADRLQILRRPRVAMRHARERNERGGRAFDQEARLFEPTRLGHFESHHARPRAGDGRRFGEAEVAWSRADRAYLGDGAGTASCARRRAAWALARDRRVRGARDGGS